MHINKVNVKNFRLLKDIELTLEETTTVIVGRNNSGKTSFTEVFKRLLSDNRPRFNLEDFTLPAQNYFWDGFSLWKEGKEDNVIRELLPIIEIKLSFTYDIDADDIGQLSEFIIDLDPFSHEVVALIKYQLKDGEINQLYDGLDNIDHEKQINQQQKLFYRLIKERIPLLYTTSLYAVDPTDETNQKELEFKKLKDILQTGFINAQRGLDDTTHKESDVLGKIVERMLDIAKSDNAKSDNQTAFALEEAVKEIQLKLDTDFNEHLNKLLPALSLFGYPGLNNTSLYTETTLDVKRLLENHTKVRYPGISGINLPETYNGLGTRNLIYILFQLFEFFKLYKHNKTLFNFHMVFIEEPEAHLHPQMQEVFIRKVNEIVNEFSKEFNDGKKWPIQFIISTHSTHIANEAPFEAIRYFLTTKKDQTFTRVKDLRQGFSKKSLKESKEFLHKYLTLTRCDLFFADRAVLIEGPTERILMPKFIEKLDQEKTPEKCLSTKYLSVVEVGGAYAQHFFPFLNFLELRTLVITDLDSVKPDNRETGTYRVKCIVSEGLYTSNNCIKGWFNNNDISTKQLISKQDKDKIREFLRIAYQIPEKIDPAIQEIITGLKEVASTSEPLSKQREITNFLVEDIVPTGRSFEDAFMLANRDLFEIIGNTSEEIANMAWEKAQKVDKTSFALDYAISKTNWNVPTYIQEGLLWLVGDFEENKEILDIGTLEGTLTND
ncbi:MAG: ATP-dependent nuclease [Bacillota bacterium]